MKWLEEQGVTIVYDTRVTNVVFDITPERKVARRIEWLHGGERGGLDVTENDLVLITNGSPVENTAWGDHHTPAKWIREIQEGSIWAPVAQHRRPGPRLRPARQVLHPHRPEQL